MAIEYRAAIECALMTDYLFFQCQQCHFTIFLYATVTNACGSVAHVAKQDVGIAYLTVHFLQNVGRVEGVAGVHEIHIFSMGFSQSLVHGVVHSLVGFRHPVVYVVGIILNHLNASVG